MHVDYYQYYEPAGLRYFKSDTGEWVYSLIEGIDNWSYTGGSPFDVVDSSTKFNNEDIYIVNNNIYLDLSTIEKNPIFFKELGIVSVERNSDNHMVYNKFYAAISQEDWSNHKFPPSTFSDSYNLLHGIKVPIS